MRAAIIAAEKRRGSGAEIREREITPYPWVHPDDDRR
jgi:hypothetical protein